MGAHHHHHHHEDADAPRLLWAAALTGSFMLAELAGGLLSGSMALLADAAHMLTDFASLALAGLAARIAARPPSARMSYGHVRLPVLAAYSNALALIAVALWIVVEAVRRLAEPVPVASGLMLAVAVVGLLVNIAAFALLHGGASLNRKAAALHVLGDLLGSVGAIAAALIIGATGWTPIDPILSILVSALLLRAAWGVLRESAHILLEGAPDAAETAAILRDLETLPQVANAHHLHIWSLSEKSRAATLHVRIAAGAAPESAARAVKARLAERHLIRHVTVETEIAACADGEPLCA